MDTNILLFALIIPLIGFLTNILFGKSLGKSISGILGTVTIVTSFVITVLLFFQIQETKEPIRINLFEWFSLENFKIDFAFYFDQLSILWLLFVTGIGSLIHLYSTS